MAVGLRSIDAVPHEVQRRRGTQGLLVQRKTMASQPSVTAAEQLTMMGGEVGGGLKRGVKCHVGYLVQGRRGIKDWRGKKSIKKAHSADLTAVVTVDIEDRSQSFVRPRSPLRKTGLGGNVLYAEEKLYLCLQSPVYSCNLKALSHLTTSAPFTDTLHSHQRAHSS